MKRRSVVSAVTIGFFLAVFSPVSTHAKAAPSMEASPWSQNIYKPQMTWSEVFGEPISIKKMGSGAPERMVEDPSLIHALHAKGDGNNAFARDSVEALLNSIVPAPDDPSCEEMATLSFPYVTDLSAETVAADAARSLPAYCLVNGTIDNNIKFEVKLPLATAWNQKFYMGGGGGMVGGIQSQGWEDALMRGYATAGSDTGHQSIGNLSAAWALNDDEKYVNFGHRAVHMTAAIAKIFVQAYYDSAIQYSYFSGCSTGGRMAMMESQRYPGDFDGIIVGAPANDYRPDNLVWIQQALFPEPLTAEQNPHDVANWKPTLPLAKLSLVESTVVAACDTADGVEDGLVDPSQCDFNPITDFPMCADDVDPGDNSCLTRSELEPLLRIYQGPIAETASDADGFSAGGCENQTSWKDWMVLAPTWGPYFYGIPNLGYSFAQEELRYFVYDDAEYDFRNFDLFSSTQLADLEKQTKDASAIDTDLSAFRDQGGKMIMYHGWCDPILSPKTTIKYYLGVEANPANMSNQDSDVRDFIRLFPAPGMLHCSGGPGPDVVDYLGALELWVEQGIAPDSLLAEHYSAGEVDRSRPLCPYPQVAVWDGIGDANQAESFSCQEP
jgi:feruloyl esterase